MRQVNVLKVQNLLSNLDSKFFSDSEPDVETECCEVNTFIYEKYNPNTHICKESGLTEIQQKPVCIDNFVTFTNDNLDGTKRS